MITKVRAPLTAGTLEHILERLAAIDQRSSRIETRLGIWWPDH